MSWNCFMAVYGELIRDVLWLRQYINYYSGICYKTQCSWRTLVHFTTEKMLALDETQSNFLAFWVGRGFPMQTNREDILKSLVCFCCMTRQFSFISFTYFTFSWINTKPGVSRSSWVLRSLREALSHYSDKLKTKNQTSPKWANF